MTIEGSTFVITGGARGIGAETARLAASRGANVVVTDVLAAEGEAVVAEIEAAGGAAYFVEADLTDDNAVEALMVAAADRFGGIDVLHNNAGIHEAMISSDYMFDNMSVDTFDRVLAVNLRAPFVYKQQQCYVVLVTLLIRDLTQGGCAGHARGFHS